MYYEQIKSFSDVERGDIIKHKSTHKSFVVTGNYGERITAVRTIDATNPSEWEVFNKDGQSRY